MIDGCLYFKDSMDRSNQKIGKIYRKIKKIDLFDQSIFFHQMINRPLYFRDHREQRPNQSIFLINRIIDLCFKDLHVERSNKSNRFSHLLNRLLIIESFSKTEAENIGFLPKL